MEYREIWLGALGALRANRGSFLLTSLGIAIGTASVILVACIVITGRQFIIGQIQGIGANMIYAEHQNTRDSEASKADDLTIADIEAVRTEVPDINASSPMYQLPEPIVFPGGTVRNVRILGVSPDYSIIRNLELLAGRMFDRADTTERAKNAAITPELATKLYGDVNSAVGQTLMVHEIPFTVIGVFRERVETFGQSEVTAETTLVPYTVAEYLSPTQSLNQIFFSVPDASEVEGASAAVKRVLQSRHRPGAVYSVENLTSVLQVANQTASALTIVLALISTVTLIIGGVGIMNIMLANIRARVREIGIRKAIGARRQDIVLQFLSESVLMSLFGGGIGTIVALGLCSAASTGIIFGTVPAKRAAELDPVSALHFE
jgi:putative ABC transport system permease protein